jgi:hypothetical protein
MFLYKLWTLSDKNILILGCCILLRLFITKNDSTTLVRNLSCLYCKTDYTTCFG